MPKASLPTKVYRGAQGFGRLLHPLVFVIWLIMLAVIIIPVAANIELGQGALIMILITLSAIYAAIVLMLEPRVFLTVLHGRVNYNPGLFVGGQETVIELSQITEIKIHRKKFFLYFIIPLIKEEVGVTLVGGNGRRLFIEEAQFGSAEEYEHFKNLLQTSTKAVITEEWSRESV